MTRNHKTTLAAAIVISLAVVSSAAIRTVRSRKPIKIAVRDFWTPQRLEQSLTEPNSPSRTLWEALDLTSNSPATQKSLALILLIPVGALITAAFRNLIGMRTIGTFSPTLLAISQVKADWRVGVAVFVSTFGVGCLVRMLFLKRRLSAVARRGIVAVFVAVFLALAISASERFRLANNARYVLLPVVVTTMMIERFFIILEKENKSEAIRVLINTLVVAVCCFALFSLSPIGPVFLAFPELELLIVVVLILIGHYSGRSLIEILSRGKTQPSEQDA